MKIQINDNTRIIINFYDGIIHCNVERASYGGDEDDFFGWGNDSKTWTSEVITASSVDELIMIGENIVKASKLLVLA